MARWQRRLEIAEDWKAAQEKTISTQELAKRLSVKLTALRPITDDEYLEEQRLEMAENFKAFGEGSEGSVDEFDCMMSELYDWADTPLDDQFGGNKLCWVATF